MRRFWRRRRESGDRRRKWKGERLAKLLVHPATLAGVRELREISDLKAAWLPARESFAERRRKVLLYP